MTSVRESCARTMPVPDCERMSLRALVGPAASPPVDARPHPRNPRPGRALRSVTIGAAPPFAETVVRAMSGRRGPSSRRRSRRNGAGLADLAAGRQVEDRHDLLAVEVGTDGGQLLLLAERRDPRLELVVGRWRACRALRWLRVVTSARDRMWSRSSRSTGVPHVAAHRRVRPHALGVAEEPQVQADELGRPPSRCRLSNRSSRSRFVASFAPSTSWWWKVTVPSGSIFRVAGLPMSWSSTARRRTRIGFVSPRLLERDRLIERRQAVLVDVLVVGVLVDLQPESRDLGKHLLGQPRVHEHADAGDRIGGEHQLA